jgi:competence protein ComEC
MALVYLSVAFVLGVYIGSHLPLPLYVALPVAIAAAVVALVWQYDKRVLLCGLCIALFLCGFLRFGAMPTGDGLQPYAGAGAVEVTGVVIEEPEPRDSSTKLILSARDIDGQEVSGTFMVRTSRYPAYQYGDLLAVSGELEQPADVDGFDYRLYLERQGIYTLMYYPGDIELVAGGQGSQPLQAIYSFRHRLGEALAASLSEPQGALARGMLLGLRYDIPQPLYEDFRDSGTAHLLAISGLHMSIVAGIVLSAMVWLFGRRRPTYFYTTLVVLWGYAMLAGMSPSVTRAAIMVSLFLLGSYVGRQRSALTAVAFAAAVMVAINPHILWSVSFQLSFAAVLGLLLLTPAFQRWLAWTRAPSFIVDSVSYSLGAIIATLPLAVYYFGYVSLVGLPATFFAVLALPAAIVLSAAVAFVGLLSIPLAQVIGWFDWLFLKYITAIVQGFAALPSSSLAVRGMSAAWVWVYYAVFGLAMWLGTRRRRLS